MWLVVRIIHMNIDGAPWKWLPLKFLINGNCSYFVFLSAIVRTQPDIISPCQKCEHQDLFIIHLKSKFWSSSGLCKGSSSSLVIFFPKRSHPLLWLYIIYVSSTPKCISHVHRSLLSSLNIHIYHYLSDISTLMAHRYLKCSMPTPKSLAAQPFFSLFSSGLSLLGKWYDGPS